MGRLQIIKLLGGLIVVFALFHWIATVLGSNRGQAGLIVGMVIAAATIATEALLFKKPVLEAVSFVGIGRPVVRGVIISAAIRPRPFSYHSLFRGRDKFDLFSLSGLGAARWRALFPGRHRRGNAFSRIPFRTLPRTAHLLEGRIIIGNSVRFGPFHTFLLKPMADRRGVDTIGGSNVVSSIAIVRDRRKHNLAARNRSFLPRRPA
jgi:hypothetical protein